MKSKATLAACAALCMTLPALAATPTVSGKYIVTERRLCQAVAMFNFDNVSATGDFVNGVDLQGGIFKNSLVLATFSPSKGTVNVSGIDEGGDSMLFQKTGTQGGTEGNAMAEAPNSGKVPYSNTDTTITINGETYHVLFGQLDKNGIAHYFAFEGLSTNDSGEPCTSQAEASRQ